CTGSTLFIFHQKFESIKTNVVFADEDALNSFAVMLGQRCGKQISVANPILDGTSVEGHRVQATYSKEVTTRGSSFTIRRYKEKPFTPVELVKFGTASAEMVAYLWVAVESGKSMMVCGGTASGKTATLNSAALFIRPGAKIVSIEDTREINLPHENWIPGVTRSGVGERGADGKAGGEIDMYDLVRRIDIVNYMVQKGMTDFREIAKIVVQYYQYPDETAKRVREEMGLPEAGIPKAVEAGGETVG